MAPSIKLTECIFKTLFRFIPMKGLISTKGAVSTNRVSNTCFQICCVLYMFT